jgi:hypothetical protein
MGHDGACTASDEDLCLEIALAQLGQTSSGDNIHTQLCEKACRLDFARGCALVGLARVATDLEIAGASVERARRRPPIDSPFEGRWLQVLQSFDDTRPGPVEPIDAAAAATFLHKGCRLGNVTACEAQRWLDETSSRGGATSATSATGAAARWSVPVLQTLVDSTTNLTWQVDPTGGEMSWDASGDHCGQLELEGLSDWRLPTIEELTSLVRGCPGVREGCRIGRGAAHGCYWPKELRGTCGWFWSSSPTAKGPDEMDQVYFNTGLVSSSGKTFASHVRCVRGGVALPSAVPAAPPP